MTSRVNWQWSDRAVKHFDQMEEDQPDLIEERVRIEVAAEDVGGAGPR